MACGWDVRAAEWVVRPGPARYAQYASLPPLSTAGTSLRGVTTHPAVFRTGEAGTKAPGRRGRCGRLAYPSGYRVVPFGRDRLRRAAAKELFRIGRHVVIVKARCGQGTQTATVAVAG